MFRAFTVLAVDDDPLQRKTVEAVLSREGITVYTASGSSDLPSIIELQPDVVLIDIDLGGGPESGVDLARTIRERYDLPVVFQSGHTDRSVIAAAEEIGAYGFVQKTVDNGAFVVANLAAAVARKQAERERSQLEDDLRGLFLYAPFGMVYVDLSGEIRRANASFCRFLGYDERELVGRPVVDISEAEDQEQDIHLYNRLIRGEIDSYQLHKAYIAKDGGLRPAFLTVFPRRGRGGEIRGIYGIVQDLADTTDIDGNLRRIHEQYTLLAYNSSDLVLLVDRAYRCSFASPSAKRILGYDSNELLAMGTADLLDEPSRRKIDAIIEGWTDADSRETQQPVTVELPLRTRSGTAVWTENIVTPMRSSDGSVAQVLWSVREIEKRRRLEQERIRTEEKYRIVLEQIADVVFTIDTDGTITYLAPSFTAVTGFPVAAFVGRTFTDVVAEEDVPATYQRFLAALEDPDGLFRVDYRLRTADGDSVPHRARGGVFRDADGAVVGIVGISRDISDEEQRIAEKDRAIREVHHRVKNNLQMLNALIAIKSAEIGDPTLLSDIQRRITAIGRIHSMLQERPDLGFVQLGRYVESITEETASLPDRKIERAFTFATVYVSADVALRIGLILNELLTNALEHGVLKAVPEDGPPFLGVSLERVDDGVTLTVENSVGSGTGTAVPQAERTGLGTGLIDAMVEDLSGRWHRETGATVRSIVTVPDVVVPEAALPPIGET